MAEDMEADTGERTEEQKIAAELAAEQEGASPPAEPEPAAEPAKERKKPGPKPGAKRGRRKEEGAGDEPQSEPAAGGASANSDPVPAESDPQPPPAGNMRTGEIETDPAAGGQKELVEISEQAEQYSIREKIRDHASAEKSNAAPYNGAKVIRPAHEFDPKDPQFAGYHKRIAEETALASAPGASRYLCTKDLHACTYRKNQHYVLRDEFAGRYPAHFVKAE